MTKLRLRTILVSVKLFARNSGAGSGCAKFVGACNLHAHKFLVLGGGVFWGFSGGGSADFIFMGAGIFLTDTSGHGKSLAHT